MEAFLSTLPPYVHEFLGKHPPTDVFNLLKELICFAVLYSDDRARIQSTTQALMKKKEAEEEKEEGEAIVPEIHTIEPIKEETEPETKEVVVKAAKPTYNIRTGELIQTDKSTMPNTFPAWWGDEGGKILSAPKQSEFPLWQDVEDNHSPETIFKQSNYDKNKPYGRSESEYHRPSIAAREAKAKVEGKAEAEAEAYGSSWITLILIA
ncbi:hypothetical protein BDF21DRAFT_248932 [Thamnidium elegans]|nr:hypothetical protein BDF21DRAFT_248932 [Thamnidium elegans]